MGAGRRHVCDRCRPARSPPCRLNGRCPIQRPSIRRGSLAEHTPSPVTPLFATLGLELANIATSRLWERFIGADPSAFFPSEGPYSALNGYAYLAFRMGGTNLLKVGGVFFSQFGSLFSGSVERWQAARQELAAVVEEWERIPVESLAPSQLLEGVRAVFGAACRYFTEIQTTLPSAAISEAMFSKLYDGLIRRKGDPSAVTFMVGFDTVALQAEKSLFDIAELDARQPGPWPTMPSQTATEQLEADLQREETPPDGLPANRWAEWRLRFQRHLDVFGRTTYEFDFATPTPQETPALCWMRSRHTWPKAAENPYRRQREALEKRGCRPRKPCWSGSASRARRCS